MFRNVVVIITLLFATALAFISFFSWLLYGFGCELEVLPKISLPNEIVVDQEILECDVIAHYEVQSVYARMLPSRKRQLLFRFDPGNPDFKTNIYMKADGSIMIEIKEISEVIYQINLFSNKFVHYNIGRVYYPTK